MAGYEYRQSAGSTAVQLAAARARLAEVEAELARMHEHNLCLTEENLGLRRQVRRYAVVLPASRLEAAMDAIRSWRVAYPDSDAVKRARLEELAA